MLIECKECGGKISSEAAACPHCGFPLDYTNGRSPSKFIPIYYKSEFGLAGDTKAVEYVNIDQIVRITYEENSVSGHILDATSKLFHISGKVFTISCNAYDKEEDEKALYDMISRLLVI